MKYLKTINTIITGGICMALGAAVFFIGFAASGFKFKTLSTDDYDKKNMTVSSDTKAIEIYEDDTNINISRSDDNKIHITYFENKDEKYNISDGDTLKIKKVSSKKLRFGFSTQITSLNISIPEKCKPSVRIDSDCGNIKVENVISQSCDISVEDGNIIINKFSAEGKSDISTDSGNINFSDSKFNGDFTVKTDDGNILTENCSYDKKADIKTTCGNVTMKEITYSSYLSLKTSDGNVNADKCNFEGKTEIKTDCGNVTVNEITCMADTSVKTSDGNVRGNINGKKDDFNIISKTSDGSNNLDDKINGRDKTLDVQTGCGNIKLEFK